MRREEATAREAVGAAKAAVHAAMNGPCIGPALSAATAEVVAAEKHLQDAIEASEAVRAAAREAGLPEEEEGEEEKGEEEKKGEEGPTPPPHFS